jgi:hypothetical protein
VIRVALITFWVVLPEAAAVAISPIHALIMVAVLVIACPMGLATRRR